MERLRSAGAAKSPGVVEFSRGYARGLWFLFSRALARRAPVVWTALGAAVAFYGFAPRIRAALLLALALAGLSVTYRLSSGSASRRLGGIGFALSLGLAWGAAAALAETARAQPGELAAFPVHSVAGVVVVDSRRTASNNTIMTIRLEEAEISSPGWRATLSWPRGRPLVLLVTDSAGEFPAGLRLEVEGPASIDSTQALWWASAGKLRPGSFVSRIPRFRHRVKKAVSDRIAAVSGKAFPLAQALLLGVKDDIDGEESRLFREAGCAHILALSGQHLSILCSLMTLPFAKLLKRGRMADIASLAIALVFTWLAGAGPSLLRAALMSLAGLLLRKLDRPQQGITVLALVFCLALGWKPADARGLSFTLSYAAMAGLLIFSSRWECLLWRLPPFLAKALAASFSALCATAPVSLGAFGSFALGGIIAATLSGPLVLLFMWSLLGSCLAGTFLPFLDSAFAWWHGFLHGALLAVMRLGSLLPLVRPGGAAVKALASAAIVALSLFVYACPYGEAPLDAILRRRRAANRPSQERHDSRL